MAESSRDKTAFTVPNRGLFQFTRMPFGLHNSAATWQRLIDEVLGADLEPNVFVYLDDIVIVSSDFARHLEILEKVFQRLKEANLSVNWEKSRFCRKELRFLGYVVNENGLQVDPEKVEAIRSYPSPRNVKQVRQFVGLAAWYRRFVPEFSKLTAPLTGLLKKSARWEWGTEQEEALSLIKEKLMSAPLLTCPDFSKPFFVQTDASNTGLGAILFQKHGEEEKPIAYASRGLASAERKFSTTEQECLAVLWAVEKFRPYLEGADFIVVTDHHALKWLSNLKDPQGRLARWALRLQQYQFTVVHRPGRQNVAADALSRAQEASISAIEVNPESLDHWYGVMLNRIEMNPSDYPAWRSEGLKLWKRVADHRKILGEEDPWKQVVPRPKRKEVLSEFHDSPLSGHLGTFKTLQRLRERFYWPGMATDTARYVAKCETCRAHKPSQQGAAGLMGKQRVVNRPWQMVSVDLMGPLPMSTRQKRYLLAFSDYFTKYVVMTPLGAATAKQTAAVMESEVFLKFGVPQVIICDNGTQFRSKEFTEKAKEYGVSLQYTPLYHPQSNPQERANRVIKTLLASYVKDNHRHWDKELDKLGFAMNTAVHEVTGYSPAYLNFGRELPRSGKDYPELESLGYVPTIGGRGEYAQKFESGQVLREHVKDRLERAYEKSRRVYNLRRRHVEYEVGDVVWKRLHIPSSAGNYFASKLAPKFGRGRIARKLSPLLYEVEDDAGRSQGIWHVKDLKPGADQQEEDGR